MVGSDESLIDFLRSWRQDKLALVLVVGLMRDSVKDSVERLKTNLELMKDLEARSRSTKYRKNPPPRLEIDHDIARRVVYLCEGILPWMEQVAELETPESDDMQVIGLA